MGTVKSSGLILSVLLLVGCYGGPSTAESNANAPRALPSGVLPQGKQSGAPAGVVTPKPVAGYYSGIYPEDQDGSCCWLAAEADFQVRVPAKSRILWIRVSLPPLQLYKSRPESLKVTGAGKVLKVFPKLAIGENLLRVPIAPDPKERTMQIHLDPGYAFVPAQQHINGDTRLLSVILESIFTQ